MGVIDWTKSPDCRSCAFELDNSCNKKIKAIIIERHKCNKCKNCERLKNIEKVFSK